MSKVYIKPLDSLRAISALFVVIYHYNYYFSKEIIQTGFTKIYYSFFEFGWLGVDLFFILSGFLITRILIQQKKSNNFFKNFYIRRALRIFPIYYLILSVYFLLPSLLGRKPLTSPIVEDNQVWLWTYLTNMPYPSMEFGDLGHLWSLAVEEHFYLIWPIIIYYSSVKKIQKICAYLIIVILIFRFWLYFRGVDLGWIMKSTFCRFDTLVYGSWLAVYSSCISREKVAFFAKKALRSSGLIIFIYISASLFPQIIRINLYSNFISLCLLPIFSIFFTSLIAVVSFSDFQGTPLSLLNSKVLQFLGKISYGIYVFHLPVQRIAAVFQTKYLSFVPKYYDSFLVQLSWVFFQIGLTIIVAILSWYFFERIFINLKEKFST